MPPPLTRQYLDSAMCSTPGCDNHDGHVLFLHGRCHPKAGSRVAYSNGVVTVACRICKKPVVEIAVAKDTEAA